MKPKQQPPVGSPEASGKQDPREDRSTDHYQEQYVQSFVEKWDELIDWERREAGEGKFFIDLLRRLGKKKVLDVATGTGFHSVQLLRAGFDVTSADGNAEMLGKAFENARQRGFMLRTIHADWRWLNRDITGRFDAIICLGNSFTHLFSERDRRRTLAEFYSALNHDGVLVLDQRNYDRLLDQGVATKHTYYYCGEAVRAVPEHIDDGLARFRYEFPDGSVYHLNMFPLRRRQLRGLMKEVGFQNVATYGDFQETYAEDDPDFFIYVATKEFDGDEPEHRAIEEDATDATKAAQSYYDSREADEFYFNIWGGEDIHIGIYGDARDGERSVREASRLTIERMIELLGDVGSTEGAAAGPPIATTQRVLDLGAGYGGAARSLAQRFGCEVVCLNLSETQNARNRALSDSAGLSSVKVVHGNFERLPFEDASFDVAWSQDAILHSGARQRVVDEVARVLRPGGRFVFTDPMRGDDVDVATLGPILERIHLDDLASFSVYKEACGRAGLEVEHIEDLSDELPRHYARVRSDLLARRAEIESLSSPEYVANMLEGLGRWIEAGEAGRLAWGIIVARKPG